MNKEASKIIGFLTIPWLLLAIIGPHFMSSLLALFSLSVVLQLFFRLRNPIYATLFFALLFQWLAINIKIVYGNIVNLSLEEQFSFYQNIYRLYDANTISNIGLICFSSGLFFMTKKRMSKLTIDKIIDPNYSVRKILICYLILTFGFSFLFILKNYIPGLNTILMAFSKLKWGVFIWAFVYANYYKRDLKLLYIVILVEVLIGFTGYFSSFKDIIIIAFIGMLSVIYQIDTSKLFKFLLLGIVTLMLGLVWTSVKMEFRDYLSGGGGQKVVVSQSDGVNKMISLLEELTLEDMEDAVDDLLDRISYIEFFSITLDNVPEKIPYQEGEIFTNAVTFYFKPRIFFPNKGIIDDSEHTNKFTMLGLVGGGKASHSIGYMTDAYIDFGPINMFPFLIFLGAIFGYVINMFFKKSKTMFWAIIFITPFYFLISVYSFNMIKVMGNMITYVVPVYLSRNLLYKYFDKYFRAVKTN
ncbi:hypothetical protein FNB79_06820 [Formosa sediminum]|uniref:Oligosaccharide repeat unit polymerase n=1 Tax=Formosa sediminum TaxID=2594004 RepID=A0A516GQQ1_9FLAO|nr:hypothetical protein [Formosa sediminum]QDO93700.1 hypothetical protein FNB79_06820 [Formosa sediminum]